MEFGILPWWGSSHDGPYVASDSLQVCPPSGQTSWVVSWTTILHVLIKTIMFIDYLFVSLFGSCQLFLWIIEGEALRGKQFKYLRKGTHCFLNKNLNCQLAGFTIWSKAPVEQLERRPTRFHGSMGFTISPNHPARSILIQLVWSKHGYLIWFILFVYTFVLNMFWGKHLKNRSYKQVGIKVDARHGHPIIK